MRRFEGFLFKLHLEISIHAPLTGCDSVYCCRCSCHVYFNPRTPYGMRRFADLTISLIVSFQSTHPLRDATLPRLAQGGLAKKFQSTHPLRDATVTSCLLCYNKRISIHAPLTGCDCKKSKITT